MNLRSIKKQFLIDELNCSPDPTMGATTATTRPGRSVLACTQTPWSELQPLAGKSTIQSFVFLRNINILRTIA